MLLAENSIDASLESVVFSDEFPYLLSMINVVVGIIIQNRNVLLCQRKQTSRYALKWEFPGGKVENGEQITDSLRRELFEELGISAEVGALFHRQHYVYPDSGAFSVFYHLITSFSGTIVNHAFAAYEWVPIEKLPTYDVLEGNYEVIQKLVRTYATIESSTQ